MLNIALEFSKVRFDIAENELSKADNLIFCDFDGVMTKISASVGSNGSSRSLRSGEVTHGAPGDRAPGAPG